MNANQILFGKASFERDLSYALGVLYRAQDSGDTAAAARAQAKIDTIRAKMAASKF